MFGRYLPLISVLPHDRSDSKGNPQSRIMSTEKEDSDRYNSNSRTAHPAAGPKNSLQIQFHRTFRLPDAQKGGKEFPPGFGTIPLFFGAEYAAAFSEAVVAEGGVFFPLYRMCFRCIEGGSLRFMMLQSGKRW